MPEVQLVGPILQASEPGRAVLAALQELNPGAQVLDRGQQAAMLHGAAS